MKLNKCCNLNPILGQLIHIGQICDETTFIGIGSCGCVGCFYLIGFPTMFGL